jgi:O-methyltransferase domain/Dimerisation domain
MSGAETDVLQLLYGRWRSQTLYVGVKLGVFEVVSDEPILAASIARALSLDAALSYRLLRALGSLDLVREHADEHFSITEAGALLASAHPHSMRDVVLLREGPEHTAVWKHLPDIIRDGMQNGFVREFGRTAFEHASFSPAYGEAFDAGMSSHSRLQSAWTLEALKGCDLSPIKHLCDVGGGQGHLLCQLLIQYPHLVGTVLERSAVLKNDKALWSKRLHLEDRCTYAEGDMFVDVPTSDAFIVKMILHDWNDDECLQILQTMSHRVSPAGRVFIVEHVIGTPEDSDFASLFDMHMMCWGTGRERTAQEYEHLLRRAGWAPAAIWSAPSGAISIVEGRKP